MFTKKPEREMGGDPLTKMSDRPVTETTPFGERSPSYVKSAGPSKLVVAIAAIVALAARPMLTLGNAPPESRPACRRKSLINSGFPAHAPC